MNELEGYNIEIYVAARKKSLFDDRYGCYNHIHFLQYDAMQPIQFKQRFDYIIHAAGLASPELYVSMPVETILSNFIGISNLLQYARKNHTHRIIYISSSEVYGKKDSEAPFIEDNYGVIDIDNIRYSYAEAKRASEMLCRSFSKEYDVYTVIARPGHVYGPSASVKDQRVSSVFAYRAAEGLPLELKSSGIQRRSYVYSVDCAMAILSIMLHGKKGEAYNVSNEETVTIREMAALYASEGKCPLIISEPSPEELIAFNPMNNSSLSSTKNKETGYSQSFNAQLGFAHTVRILREITRSSK